MIVENSLSITCSQKRNFKKRKPKEARVIISIARRMFTFLVDHPEFNLGITYSPPNLLKVVPEH